LSDGGRIRALDFSVARMVAGTAAVYDSVLASRATQSLAS